jgi:hypothetical protein
LPPRAKRRRIGLHFTAACKEAFCDLLAGFSVTISTCPQEMLLFELGCPLRFTGWHLVLEFTKKITFSFSCMSWVRAIGALHNRVQSHNSKSSKC